MRLSSWLPGISAAARLGVSERDDEPIRGSLRREVARETPEKAASLTSKLPERDDSFYWALVHSHL